MKINAKQLRDIIQEVLMEVPVVKKVQPAKKMGAGRNYMKKEMIREKIQDLLQDAVGSGNVMTQADLDDWFATADMALKALQSVPIDVYRTIKK